jgi:hypothetical protein
MSIWTGAERGKTYEIVYGDLMRSLSWMFGDIADMLAGVCGDAIPARETGAEWRPGE